MGVWSALQGIGMGLLQSGSVVLTTKPCNTATAAILQHYKPNIKIMKFYPADIWLPWSNATYFLSLISIFHFQKFLADPKSSFPSGRTHVLDA